MFRLLDKAAGILAMALAGLLVCLYTWPLWTASALLALYLLGRHLQEKEHDAFLAREVALLSPMEYERYCAMVLARAGWRAGLTPRRDQGADIVAELRGFRAVIQCKHYAGKVGNRAVQEVAAARLHYGAQIAAVACPNGYTDAAWHLAASCRVHLLDHVALSRLERIAGIPAPPSAGKRG